MELGYGMVVDIDSTVLQKLNLKPGTTGKIVKVLNDSFLGEEICKVRIEGFDRDFPMWESWLKSVHTPDERLIVISRNDDAPKRKRYKWEIVKYRKGIDGWGFYTDFGGYGSEFGPVQGYKRTLKEAELAARERMCGFQLTAKETDSFPVWIEP